MDSARSWFQKFQPRDRLRSATKKNDSTGEEESGPLSAEEASNVTKQKVAAAKQYIENHYKEQMKNLQERKERYVTCLKSLYHLMLDDCPSYFHFWSFMPNFCCSVT